MKKFLKYHLLIAAGLFIACSPKVAERIAWLDTSLNESGFPTEYTGVTLRYNREAKVVYMVGNDSQNLYICLRIPEENTQRQVMMAGMSITLDSGKKAHQDRRIVYPLAVDPGKTPNQPGMAGPKNKATIRREYLLQQNEFDIWGFNVSGSGRLSRYSSSGIKVKIDWDSLDIMVYQAIIPLGEIYHSSGGLSDTSALFTLGVNINELQLPPFPGGGMSGGGPPGGGMPSGPPPGGMPDRGSGNGPMGMDAGSTARKSFQFLFKLNFNESQPD